MNVKGSFSYKKAITIDENLLIELQYIILEYFDKISYSAKLINNDIIRFSSLEEIIDYENFKERKINSLTISMDMLNEIIIDTPISFINSYDKTVLCTYNMEEMDNILIYQKKIINTLEKHKRNFFYTIFTKISSMHFIIMCGFLGIISSIYSLTLEKHEIKTHTSLYEFNLFLYIVCILMLIFFIIFRIRLKIVPPITFRIGYEIKEDDKRNKFYDNFFWVIIIGLILAFVSTNMF